MTAVLDRVFQVSLSTKQTVKPEIDRCLLSIKSEMAEPPVVPKEYLTKSSKFMWRALLISNFALGGYIFLKARNREIGNANKKKAKETSARNKKAVVEELPSTLPGNPTDAPSTSTTTSQTWDS